MNTSYLIVLISCCTALKSMDLGTQREAQAAQEISRIEAFMASDFSCDQNGIVSYQHFVTRARAATTFRKIHITRTQTPYQPYQEHVSTMCNYLSTLHRVLLHCMTREKYLSDPCGFEPICKKIDELTASDTDQTARHKKTIKAYKTMTAQDLAPIAALDFYSFITYLDLEGHEKKYSQNEKDQFVQYRTELIEACNQRSTDQIRRILARPKTFFLDPYREHSTCCTVEAWIYNEKRDFLKTLSLH